MLLRHYCDFRDNHFDKQVFLDKKNKQNIVTVIIFILKSTQAVFPPHSPPVFSWSQLMSRRVLKVAFFTSRHVARALLALHKRKLCCTVVTFHILIDLVCA